MRKLTAKEVEKLKGIIADNIGRDEDEITPNAHIVHDLGGDSLDAIEIVMEVEENFGVTIEDDEAEGAATYNKFVELLEKKLS